MARHDTKRLLIFRRGAENRKLRQRRSLRRRIPGPRVVVALAVGATGRGLRLIAPFLAILAAGALLAALGWHGWRWATTSPRFAVKTVAVTGNSRVTRDEILRRAAIAPGTNVFSVPLDEVERRVAAEPWVAGVRAARRLPSTVIIAVTERRPAALVLLGGVYLVDAQGHPFKRAAIEDGEADGLVAVTGLTREGYVRDPEATAAAIRAGLAVAERWRRGGGRPAVGEVHLDRAGVTLYTLEGAVAVRLGAARGEDLEARLARFDVIWAALSPEERAVASTIHLDSAARPDRVTVELADARRKRADDGQGQAR